MGMGGMSTNTQAAKKTASPAKKSDPMMNMMGSIMGSMMKKKEPETTKKDPVADTVKMLLGAVSGAQGGAKKMTSLLQTVAPVTWSSDDIPGLPVEDLKDMVCGLGDN